MCLQTLTKTRFDEEVITHSHAKTTKHTITQQNNHTLSHTKTTKHTLTQNNYTHTHTPKQLHTPHTPNNHAHTPNNRAHNNPTGCPQKYVTTYSCSQLPVQPKTHPPIHKHKHTHPHHPHRHGVQDHDDAGDEDGDDDDGRDQPCCGQQFVYKCGKMPHFLREISPGDINMFAFVSVLGFMLENDANPLRRRVG